MIGKIITPRVLQWLRGSDRGRILHLFPEACNLINERDEVIALVSSRIGPGPIMITLDRDFTTQLRLRHEVVADDATKVLAVGPLRVDYSRAAVWQSAPDWSRLRGTGVAMEVSRRLPGLPQEIGRHLSQAIDGLTRDDLAAFLAGVRGLAGRGPGLTPAGDDVLMGLFYGLWVWRPKLRPWAELAAQTAAPRTTSLSASFLRAAAAGEAVWQWHDLAGGRAGAIDDILAIGHSSGADALAGFAAAGLVFGREQVAFPIGAGAAA